MSHVLICEPLSQQHFYIRTQFFCSYSGQLYNRTRNNNMRIEIISGKYKDQLYENMI